MVCRSTVYASLYLAEGEIFPSLPLLSARGVSVSVQEQIFVAFVKQNAYFCVVLRLDSWSHLVHLADYGAPPFIVICASLPQLLEQLMHHLHYKFCEVFKELRWDTIDLWHVAYRMQ